MERALATKISDAIFQEKGCRIPVEFLEKCERVSFYSPQLDSYQLFSVNPKEYDIVKIRYQLYNRENNPLKGKGYISGTVYVHKTDEQRLIFNLCVSNFGPVTTVDF